MSDEINRAYLLGMKLKNSGLDEETIYARLEKQGIDAELAKKVAKDIMIERRKDTVRNETPNYYTGLIVIGIGIVATAVSAIALPGKVIVPVGVIVSGIVYVLIAKNKMKN